MQMQETRKHGSRTCQYATSTLCMSLYLCAAVYLWCYAQNDSSRSRSKDDMVRPDNWQNEASTSD